MCFLFSDNITRSLCVYDLQQIQSAIAGTLGPQGIVVPASALQQGNVTMATVAGMATEKGTLSSSFCRKKSFILERRSASTWFLINASSRYRSVNV